MTSPLPQNPVADLIAPPVRLQGWGWRHPGREAWAVRDVTLEIAPQECVLIVGNSGAGKSTLLHGIAGVLGADEGESEGTLTIAGMPASSPMVRGHVGLVQQDPETQRVMGRLGDEVAFGLENIGLPAEQIWPRVKDALAVVGLGYPLDHPTSHLSGGEKQRLALACALAMRPRVMLLDEPTANLDTHGAEEVRRATEDLANQSGATLIIVEHNLAPWIDRADRLIVLTEGGVVADGPPRRVIADHGATLREAGVWIPGDDPLQFLPPRSGPGRSQVPGSALTTTDLAVGYKDAPAVLTGLDLTFERGRSTCVVGPNGAGKTTTALTLAGLLQPRSGAVHAGPQVCNAANVNTSVHSDKPTDWSPVELLGRISMVFQEPQYQFLTSSVEEELALGPKLSGLGGDQIAARVGKYLDLLHLRHLRAAHPLSLSGGERRRLGVGTALIAAPEVVVLDEPTFGQDFNTWVDLVSLLVEARGRGTTLIIITHDKNLVRALGEDFIEIEDAAGATPIAQAPTRVVSQPRTPLSRVNPAAQLLGLLLMTIPLMLSIDPVSAGIALLLEMLLLPLARLRPRTLLIRLSPLLVAAPLAAVSMLLYAAPGGEIHAAWGPVVISQNSVTLALSMSLRVLAVGLPAVVILPSLGSTEVADSLTQVVHLPSRFVLSSLAAVRMVGLMLSDWAALKRARRSRGMDGAHFAKAAFSLTTFALRRADSLSVSMEARGFGSDIPRSNARVSRLSRADAVMVAVCALVPAIALGVAAAVGTFSLFGIG